MDIRLILISVWMINVQTHCAIFTPEQEKRITEFVETLMDCKHNPGLTVAVVKGSNTWAKGFGLADLDTRRTVQNDTMFVIGSLGKAFTMTLLGNLLQGTSYSWSTKLADIAGVDLQFVTENLTKEVTLADLLSHQTGLWDIVDYGFIAGYPEGTTIEFLSSRLKYIPKKYSLRYPVLHYNNAMYMALGHVIEVLGKDTWHNLMTSRILEPLGMTKTKLMSRADDVLVGNVAKPYIMPGRDLVNATAGLYKITPLEPAGGILSSAVDMAKWIRFNLYGGITSNDIRLVDEQLFNDAIKKQRTAPYYAMLQSLRTPTFPVNCLYDGYGYAWFTSTYRGFRRVSHSGGYFAYNSKLWLFPDPDQDFGIFINVNGPGKPGTSEVTTDLILYYLADIVLGFEPWLNSSTACTYPAPWGTSGNYPFELPEVPTYTNDQLGDFPGRYGSPILPDITIALSEDESKLRLVWNRIRGDLLPSKEPDSFDFKMTEPWEYAAEIHTFGDDLPTTFPVQFTRDAEGLVQKFTLALGDTAIMPFSKGVFFKPSTTSGAAVLEDGAVLESRDTAGATRFELSSYLLVVICIVTCYASVLDVNH